MRDLVHLMSNPTKCIYQPGQPQVRQVLSSAAPGFAGFQHKCYGAGPMMSLTGSPIRLLSATGPSNLFVAKPPCTCVTATAEEIRISQKSLMTRNSEHSVVGEQQDVNLSTVVQNIHFSTKVVAKPKIHSIHIDIIHSNNK